MSIKATRVLVATIALAGLVGMTTPAEAAAPAKQARSIWCC